LNILFSIVAQLLNFKLKKNMRMIILSMLCLFLLKTGVSQPIPKDSLYLGQTPPDNIPKIFKLPVDQGYISQDRIAITNDGKKVFYLESPISSGNGKLRYFSYVNNKWTGPFNLPFENFWGIGLSIDEDTMFIQKNNPDYQHPQAHISVFNGTDWSTPKAILSSFSTAHYLQISKNNHRYIAAQPSKAGVGGTDWSILTITGSDTSAISLGLPLNTAGDEGDFCVSKDDSFMIFNRVNEMVSFHKKDGSWTNPKTLGSKVSSKPGRWGAYISPDNKYLFYTCYTTGQTDTYVYWVRIDNLIDSLKRTNFIPYLKNFLKNRTDTVGVSINYTIPDSTFIDDDGNNTLTFSATLSTGGALPSWLSFNSATRTFAGTPTEKGTLNLKITATDNAKATVSTTLKISVIDNPTSANRFYGQNIKFYPNPTRGLASISLGAFSGKKAIVEVTNFEGKIIQKDTFTENAAIDLTGNPKGIYILKLIIADGIFYKKICLE
jgi:hypothetical protein